MHGISIGVQRLFPLLLSSPLQLLPSSFSKVRGRLERIRPAFSGRDSAPDLLEGPISVTHRQRLGRYADLVLMILLSALA